MSMLNSSIKRKFSSLEFGIREKTILSLIIFAVFFITILVAGSMIDPEKFSIDLINKNQSPSIMHISRWNSFPKRIRHQNCCFMLRWL